MTSESAQHESEVCEDLLDDIDDRENRLVVFGSYDDYEFDWRPR
ncbi:hypothetical protein ACFC1R_32405 [Kitasatospora sp. NPDC056138]